MSQLVYVATADELVNRISALIPSHPEILSIENPFDLFKVEGFKCDDLQPSLAQASWALSKAKAATNTACTGLAPTGAQVGEGSTGASQ